MANIEVNEKKILKSISDSGYFAVIRKSKDYCEETQRLLETPLVGVLRMPETNIPMRFMTEHDALAEAEFHNNDQNNFDDLYEVVSPPKDMKLWWKATTGFISKFANLSMVEAQKFRDGNRNALLSMFHHEVCPAVAVADILKGEFGFDYDAWYLAHMDASFEKIVNQSLRTAI